MVKVEKTYDVELKGTGRIDNIGKMTSDRVVTFKNLNLLPNEKLKKFTVVATDELSLFPWIQPLLPAGDSYHLIDVETYLPSPYAVASGYELKFLKMWSSADQPHSARVYMETQLIAVGVYTAGGVYNEQDIALPSTAYIDPDSSDPHVLDFVMTNVGIGPLWGSGLLIALLIDHGSDPDFEHKTKQVRCPQCNSIKTVPIEATKITCDNGHDFIVEYHPWGGGA